MWFSTNPFFFRFFQLRKWPKYCCWRRIVGITSRCAWEMVMRCGNNHKHFLCLRLRPSKVSLNCWIFIWANECAPQHKTTFYGEVWLWSIEYCMNGQVSGLVNDRRLHHVCFDLLLCPRFIQTQSNLILTPIFIAISEQQSSCGRGGWLWLPILAVHFFRLCSTMQIVTCIWNSKRSLR